QVEHARLGELALLCFTRPLARLLVTARILELVGTEAALARAAVHERIGEAGDVAAGFPRARMHEDRGVQSFDVIAHPHHRLPPRVLEIFLQLDAERAIIPD